MLRRLTAITLLTLMFAPAASVAQENPFQGLPPAQPDDSQTATATPSSNTTDDNGGLTRGQELMLFAGGVILIAGIGYAIVRDARSRAPVEDERAYYSHRSSEEQARKRKADRKKTRAQKAARKRQRAKR
jgi:hypothetical protein